ncbi:DUF6193 family natural product biosynthesis protein [Catenuloplanes sp. NPDC051500]|uniref:DUF6193 family natural product biosynthesis protein n=1 Tax=Catenuloplanes sp. NPDC051500 TaxID=3363959 RepID=UPI0037B7B2D6
MPDETRPAFPLYPDISAFGDLRTALQTTFDDAGQSWHVQLPASPGWAHTGAELHAVDRSVIVLMARDERALLIMCSMRHVQIARGNTTELRAAADAVSLFLAGAPLRQFGKACPFIRFSSFAEAYEHSEADAIEHRWRQYLDTASPHPRRVNELHDFLAAAAHVPQLRALFPFTSHLDLGFRRSVTHRHGPALAWVRPFGNGTYLVAGTDRRQLYTPGPDPRTLWNEKPTPGAKGPATAQDAVALMLAALDQPT